MERPITSSSISRYIDPLPFASGTFDKIIFSEVLPTSPDDWGGLKEIKRVLKPGGYVFLSVPNHNYPFWWDPINKTLEGVFRTHIQNGTFVGIWANHERLYYPDQIKALVTLAGFEIHGFYPVLHYCFPFAHNLVSRFRQTAVRKRDAAPEYPRGPQTGLAAKPHRRAA